MRWKLPCARGAAGGLWRSVVCIAYGSPRSVRVLCCSSGLLQSTAMALFVRCTDKLVATQLMPSKCGRSLLWTLMSSASRRPPSHYSGSSWAGKTLMSSSRSRCRFVQSTSEELVNSADLRMSLTWTPEAHPADAVRTVRPSSRIPHATWPRQQQAVPLASMGREC